MELVTYLAFDGQCEAAFKHYEKVLGGKILAMMRGKDMPAGMPMPPEAAERITHARLQVGNRLLMGGDGPSGKEHKPQGFCAHIMLDDPAEAERIFHELAEGGTVTMPIAETFWAHKFGMVTDKFGVPWMINCEKPEDAEASANKPFTISHEFDAPRDVAWDAFTDAKRLKKWWGPKGAIVTTSNLDLRPGGTFHYCLQMPDQSEMWGRFVYRQIVPQKRLVFVSSFSNPEGGVTRHAMAPTWPIEMLSVFDFSEKNGRTKFTVTWSPLNPTAEERATFEAGRTSMMQGWSGTMERLAAYLAKA